MPGIDLYGLSLKHLNVISPLVKWAGGKRQLIPTLNNYFPISWNAYFEPFVGGGAILVHLQNEGRISHAVVSDLNRELINLYRVVKKHPETLIAALTSEKLENNEEMFRQLKVEFNDLIGCQGNYVRRATLLIYLNKHGYNGLWRVNRKGKFNVPFGHHPKRSLPSEVLIRSFSRMLENVTILNADFEKSVRTAKKDDFVYFDPPYQPISKTAHFTDYNSSGFTFDDQVRLSELFRTLSKKGVKVMLSNSKVGEIEELYQDYTIRTVSAKRYINCDGNRRTGTSEIVVTNYED
jgi:DNA adenine methylase